MIHASVYKVKCTGCKIGPYVLPCRSTCKHDRSQRFDHDYTPVIVPRWNAAMDCVDTGQGGDGDVLFGAPIPDLVVHHTQWMLVLQKKSYHNHARPWSWSCAVFLWNMTPVYSEHGFLWALPRWLHTIPALSLWWYTPGCRLDPQGQWMGNIQGLWELSVWLTVWMSVSESQYQMSSFL